MQMTIQVKFNFLHVNWAKESQFMIPLLSDFSANLKYVIQTKHFTQEISVYSH